MPKEEEGPPILDQAQTDDLIEKIIFAMLRKNKKQFDQYVESSFGRTTVWQIIDRPNRSIENFEAKHLSGSAVDLVLGIRDEVSVKQRNFNLDVEWGGEHWIVKDWEYRR